MSSDHIQISQRQVTTVGPQDTTEIQLRLIDWRRIFRKVTDINPGFAGRELFAGSCWGITSSCFLALVPLYQATEKTEAWVKPTFWITAIASGIVGYIIFRGAKDYAKEVTAARTELMIDMKEIHSLYFPSDDLGK